MHRRSKLLPILKWAALVLSLVLLACAAISGVRMVYYEGYGWGFLLDEAIVTAHWGFAPPITPPGLAPRGWSIRPMTVRLGFRFLSPRVETWPDGRTVAYLPIWVFLTPLLVATALLWWLDRRRIPPGHCRRCGYDLTGNTSGRCPECGLACRPA
ncbi:MAG TPA: hypothetical protein VMV94_13365 [Phycisphaerae bacterium]|nr:hypothetical protein [Phycisphaerae bacterium]